MHYVLIMLVLKNNFFFSRHKYDQIKLGQVHFLTY